MEEKRVTENGVVTVHGVNSNIKKPEDWLDNYFTMKYT